jgi:hypothetical protein
LLRQEAAIYRPNQPGTCINRRKPSAIKLKLKVETESEDIKVLRQDDDKRLPEGFKGSVCQWL